MVFKKHNPGCGASGGCSCEGGGPSDPCLLFSDGFSRGDSGTIGNGWSTSSGSDSIDGGRLRMSGDPSYVIAPISDVNGKVVRVTVYLSQEGQEARVYWNGSSSFAAIRLNDYDGDGFLRMVHGGTVVDSALLGFAGGAGTPVELTLCAVGGAITAYAGGQSVTYNRGGGSLPAGDIGLGTAGDFSTGDVYFDDFAVEEEGGDCLDCGASGCSACSNGYDFLADLTGFSGMGDDIPPHCPECGSFGAVYLLEQIASGTCTWRYNHAFCEGYEGGPCGPVVLLIQLSLTTGGPCRPLLEIGFVDPIGGCGNWDQGIAYVGDEFDLANRNSATVVVRKLVPGASFDGASRPCTAIVPPETILLTRV